MASAAAVAADSMSSPLDNTTTADGTVTGTVQPRHSDSDADDSHANGEDDDLDDDAEATGGVDDLFGDEDDDVPRKQKRRHVDDEELDSGDDSGRDERMGDVDNDHPMEDLPTHNVATMELPRRAIPLPSDGEMYLLKVPDFLEIEPKGWVNKDFQPPKTDHHSRKPPSATFSAYGTAMTTIRWRRSPSDPSQLQSNARILRWSDGSLTLQLASDPLTQYDLPANALAPPQINPAKPTPTSIRDLKNKSRRSQYNAAKDSHVYLATPYTNEGFMRFTNKITTALQVLNTAAGTNGVVDEALEKLQDRFLEAQRAKEEAVEGGMLVSQEETLEDPEMAKKRAEAAEKEKSRAQRKIEAQINRDKERNNRALGRAGISSSRGGLTIGGLEDDDAGTSRYAGGRPSKPKKKRVLRDEYSDEDDYAGRRTTKEDEYDMDDGFMADSDEDVDAEADEDDEEDIDDMLDRQERARDGPRGPSPKRTAAAAVDKDDEDGEGGNKTAASKRRRVIDDDEDDE